MPAAAIRYAVGAMISVHCLFAALETTPAAEASGVARRQEGALVTGRPLSPLPPVARTDAAM